jgi:Fe-S cluster assembly iron-binding protein IscA
VLSLHIIAFLTVSSAIDHRTWKTGLPVRSVVLKPCAGRLVVGWVTTSEYLLLIVLHFLQLLIYYDRVYVSFCMTICELTNVITEQRLQQITETSSPAAPFKSPQPSHLRVTVTSGGCHGFQYLMSLEGPSKVDPEEDTIFVAEDEAGTGKAEVVMDSASLELLRGSTIDFDGARRESVRDCGQSKS